MYDYGINLNDKNIIKKVKTNIQQFLNCNGLNLLNTRKNINNSICINNEWYDINQILKPYQIKNEHPIEELKNNNEKGLKTTKDIEEYIVLGIIDGMKMTHYESERLLGKSKSIYKVNCYETKIKINDQLFSNLTQNEKKSLNNKNYCNILIDPETFNKYSNNQNPCLSEYRYITSLYTKNTIRF